MDNMNTRSSKNLKTDSAKSTVVLFSSGLDSTVNLYEAQKSYEIKLVLTFDYGQRAAQKEIQYSSAVCKKLNLPHKILDLSWFHAFTQSSLLDKTQNIPVGESVKIRDKAQSEITAESVWVPNRNGIFLNIAAGFAEGLKADSVVVGFNLEEAQSFPDNSVSFMNILNESFKYSTSNQVQVDCFTENDFKDKIYKKAMNLDVDFNLVWPCYFGGENLCGECESCKRYFSAKEANL